MSNRPVKTIRIHPSEYVGPGHSQPFRRDNYIRPQTVSKLPNDPPPTRSYRMFERRPKGSSKWARTNVTST